MYSRKRKNWASVMVIEKRMQRFSNIRTLSRMAAECGGARCVSEKYLHTTPPPTHDCAGNTPSTRFLYTNQRLCLLRDNKWRPRFCAQSSLNSGTEWNGRSARWTMCWSNNTQTHDALWSLFVFFNYHIASWWNKRRGILIGLFLHQATCCLFFSPRRFIRTMQSQVALCLSPTEQHHSRVSGLFE